MGYFGFPNIIYRLQIVLLPLFQSGYLLFSLHSSFSFPIKIVWLHCVVNKMLRADIVVLGQFKEGKHSYFTVVWCCVFFFIAIFHQVEEVYFLFHSVFFFFFLHQEKMMCLGSFRCLLKIWFLVSLNGLFRNVYCLISHFCVCYV